jgi:hypothetical protein
MGESFGESPKGEGVGAPDTGAKGRAVSLNIQVQGLYMAFLRLVGGMFRVRENFLWLFSTRITNTLEPHHFIIHNRVLIHEIDLFVLNAIYNNQCSCNEMSLKLCTKIEETEFFTLSWEAICIQNRTQVTESKSCNKEYIKRSTMFVDFHLNMQTLICNHFLKVS